MGSSGTWRKPIVVFAAGVVAGALLWFSIRAEGILARHQQELAPIGANFAPPAAAPAGLYSTRSA